MILPFLAVKCISPFLCCRPRQHMDYRIRIAFCFACQLEHSHASAYGTLMTSRDVGRRYLGTVLIGYTCYFPRKPSWRLIAKIKITNVHIPVVFHSANPLCFLFIFCFSAKVIELLRTNISARLKQKLA